MFVFATAAGSSDVVGIVKVIVAVPAVVVTVVCMVVVLVLPDCLRLC